MLSRVGLSGLLLAMALGLCACSGAVRWDDAQPPSTGTTTAPPSTTGERPEFHVVRPGETLYGIASRYGLQYPDLARWNGLGDGSLIRVGQRLRLRPPGAPNQGVGQSAQAPDVGPGDPPPAWRWPVAGSVVVGFRQSPMTNSGIQIGGQLGESIRAAASGQVVYSGTGLAGYGALLIVKHNDTWLSAYGHNQALLVSEGDRVQTGQAIARMGEGPGRRPVLHFEIRRNGEPVDPLGQLPAR